MSNRFFDLLEESVILQGILTLSIWGAIIYLVVSGKEVPDVVSQGGALILGFFFGAKQAVAVARTVQATRRKGE